MRNLKHPKGFNCHYTIRTGTPPVGSNPEQKASKRSSPGLRLMTDKRLGDDFSDLVEKWVRSCHPVTFGDENRFGEVIAVSG